jgi:hypothetical protein
VTPAEPGRPPWWLWPNLLSLDAPLVAVVWQRFLAREYGASVTPATTVVLAAAVWLVYAADRRLDARRTPQPDTATDRHHFAARHGRAFDVLLLVTAAGVFALAVTALPRPIWTAGLGLAAVLAGYFALTHVGPGALIRVTKEVLVGVVFAAGAALPVWAERPEAVAEWGPAVGLFAALCTYNCLLIDAWEGGAGRARWRPALGLVLTAAGALFGGPVGVATAVSAAALTGLDVCRGAIGVRALRVLADAVLLTPVPFLIAC